jgi:hypothetical protein
MYKFGRVADGGGTNIILESISGSANTISILVDHCYSTVGWADLLPARVFKTTSSIQFIGLLLFTRRCYNYGRANRHWTGGAYLLTARIE